MGGYEISYVWLVWGDVLLWAVDMYGCYVGDICMAVMGYDWH